MSLKPIAQFQRGLKVLSDTYASKDPFIRLVVVQAPSKDLERLSRDGAPVCW